MQSKEDKVVSVVLSTYNGERYISELLLSLLNQTVAIDEVLICDDCSKDKTVQIIDEFVSVHNLKNWSISVNEINKGWKVNFKELLLKAHGEYVFLCDQDDIWISDKVEKMIKVMENNPKIYLLASEYNLLLEKNGVFYDKRCSIDDNSIKKVDFNVKSSFYIRRPGCVYCVKNELIKYIKEYAFPDYPHDAFLWRTAAMLDGLYIYNSPTIHYRRHETNATGHEVKTIQTKLVSMDYYLKAIQSMKKFIEDEKVINPEEKMTVVKTLNEWAKLRKDFLKNGKTNTWFKLLKYRECFWSKKTMLADLLMKKGLI